MKVRIYKSPDGNGKYLNKTGQFLEKAQKGKIVKDIPKADFLKSGNIARAETKPAVRVS